jgi:putative drug exporter of the RND superfamily
MVTHYWPIILVGWAAVFAGLWFAAPAWNRVAKSGQFAYLPADAPSRRAETLFREAFPDERAASAIVLVASRADRDLSPDDLGFIEGVLVPRLQQAIQDEPGWESVFSRIRSPSAGPTGLLLRSRDRRAALVVIELKPEFLDKQNWPVVDRVESLVGDMQADPGTPAGLELALDGSAVLGRDTGKAELESGRAVKRWTIIVVAGLLLLVYRAPLLAVIPLITVFAAIEVALKILGLIAVWGRLDLYVGVSLYVTVVGYGAGVDYCLFLIGRCKEEWDEGKAIPEAVGESVARVGPAITASTATVALGVAMMGFAEFGKMRQAGLAIALSLAVMLVAAHTLAPALLCLAGRWAFWPAHRGSARRSWSANFWNRVGRVLARRPGIVWCATVAVLAPFAVFGAWHAGTVSYDLTRNVREDSSTVAGLQVIRKHYPAGTTGPVTVLIHNAGMDFHRAESVALIADLDRRLAERSGDLGIVDVRSIADPLGTSPEARQAVAGVPPALARQRAASYYVGRTPGGHDTRINLVLSQDPFAKSGIDALNELERSFPESLPPPLRRSTDLHFLGSSADIKDLQSITTRDRWRIDALVVAAVLVVLLVLLRRPVLSVYLIMTVVLGYLTTLGVTLLILRLTQGADFVGPDWKVPIFLFTILVAVGEDYNIFLVTRVREEEKQSGTSAGVIEAVARTGGVITSCGLIMAGTFATLFAGSLAELHQMGFALAFGVLLDTLIIRPVLVPCWIHLTRRRTPASGVTAPVADEQFMSSTRH